MAATIAKIRSRWKEAAAGDLLDAQLALDQGNPAAASAAFDAALKKDPNNKIVQFWKAQLDSRTAPRPRRPGRSRRSPRSGRPRSSIPGSR